MLVKGATGDQRGTTESVPVEIIHNIYPTRILLYKMDKATDSNCCFCKVRDYIEYFLAAVR